MSDYRFQVVRQFAGAHDIARGKSKYVVEQFVKTRVGFTLTEHVAGQEVTEFVITNDKNVVIGKLFVLINSVLFTVYGAAAAEEAWNMEADMVDLMDQMFSTAGTAEKL